MKQAKSSVTRPRMGEGVLLLWLRTCECEYRKLSTNCVREVSRYFFGLVLLPGVYGNLLRVFSVSGGKRTTVHTQPHSPSYFIMLDRVNALALSESVFLVNLLTYEETPWPSMLSLRHSPGIIKHQQAVYVFGGINRVFLKTSERLDILPQAWSHLPDMTNCRSGFTPSEYAGELYLPSAVKADSETMEVFTVASQQFRLLGFHWGITDARVSFVSDGELFVLTVNNLLGRWRVNSSETTFRVVSVPAQCEYCSQSNCTPLIVDRSVYWVSFESQKLVKLDLATLTVSGG